MDTPERQMSLEEDLYIPCGTSDFSDHYGYSENLIDINSSNSEYQRFSRIASAQELEELDIFYDTNDDTSSYSLTSDSGIHEFSQGDPLLRSKSEEEWKTELLKTEEEIATLRSVLSAKINRMQELKRKLGITVWKEFREDMEQGIRNIQESAAYQKTSQTLKSAGEKTSEAFGSLQATVSKKLDEVKKSSTFKSIEEKVGSAVTDVKTKVAGNNTSETNEMSSDTSRDMQEPKIAGP